MTARQVRFTSAQQVKRRRAALKACIADVIGVERAGLKVDKRETSF